MRARRSQSGFTLVELIVATTLMALVFSGVYLTFATAVRSWRSAESNYATYEDARRALGVLERELHSIPSDAIHLMLGSQDAIEFVTLAQPMNVETAPSDALIDVTYSVKGDELIREEAPVEGALPEPPIPPSRDLPAPLKVGRRSKFVVARGVHNLQFDYSWAGPNPPAPPGAPPIPARIATDFNAIYVLPEVIGVTLELDDPGNVNGGGVSAFRSVVTFRGPTSPMPDDLRQRERL